MVKRVQFEGRTYEFPDDATDEEIGYALQGESGRAPAPASSQPQVSQGEDIARSGVTGLQEGASSVPGFFGDLQELNAEAGGVGMYWMLRAQGWSDADARTRVQAQIDLARQQRRDAGVQLPTSRSVNEALLNVEPESVREWTAHEPQTTAGEYARTGGNFAPNILFPGRAPMRLARVAVPAAASETAGQLAREYAPELETPARIAAAVGSAGATEVAGARTPPPVSRTPQGPPPDPWEFFERTVGEREGNARAIQRENDLRRAGPAEAQQTLRNFDDRRSAQLQDNLMRRVATRGRNPNTESVGDAGVVVADDLRAGYEAMGVEQAARYRRAMELAEGVPVAPTDELGAAVARIVDSEFLDAGPAVGVINRLNAQIRAGEATYGSVERARQALNRQLGAALRSPDGAADAYAIHRIIDELDAFVEPRLAGEAQTAIREARRYTREMMNMYGEQARPDLSTGHIGRADPGGRVIGRILDTDTTGEQVIDAIFGAGGRPPRSVLSAVRRIHDRATNQIVSGGYDAPTGGAGQQQRAAGRETLRGGRSTRGGRQFLEPSDAQRARLGLQEGEREAISDPALQALREAFVYRLGRRLANRQPGDGLPARQMANDLRAALDGSGAEITPLLFNGEEIGLLRRALADLESASPPSGQYMPSAPGIAQDAAERSFAAISARLLGRVPVVGPAIGGAIEEGIVNARAIRDARNAVAQPQAQPFQVPRVTPRPAWESVPYSAVLADEERERERRAR